MQNEKGKRENVGNSIIIADLGYIEVRQEVNFVGEERAAL